jgi:hypothetical protein
MRQDEAALAAPAVRLPRLEAIFRKPQMLEPPNPPVGSHAPLIFIGAPALLPTRAKNPIVAWTKAKEGQRCIGTGGYGRSGR